MNRYSQNSSFPYIGSSQYGCVTRRMIIWITWTGMIPRGIVKATAIKRVLDGFLVMIIK